MPSSRCLKKGCRRWVAVMLLAFFPLLLPAQESQFERMKGELSNRSIPLVNLTVDTSRVVSETFVDASIEIADYQRRTDPSSDTVSYRCLVRYRGNNSLSFNKKSYAVKLVDDNGNDLDAPVLGIRKENSWILDAMAVDRSRMRNRVCFDIWNRMSHTPYETKYGNRNGTAGCFVELFINGDYWGLYCLSDKIDRKLLGLKKAEQTSTGMALKGLLYKGINWESGYDLLSYKDDPDVEDGKWNAWELQYPQEFSTLETWQPLMDLIDFCSHATSDSDFLAHYHDYFYVDNLTDYVVFTWAMNVGDNGYKNTFLSVPDITQGHRFLVTPWDMDMSLGGYWDGTYYDVATDASFYWSRAPYNRLLMNNLDKFLDRVVERYKECLYGILSEQRVMSDMRRYAAQLMLSGAWKREVEKWSGDPVPLKKSLFDELDYIAGWYWRNQIALGKQLGVDAIHEITGDSNGPKRRGIYTVDGRKVDVGDGRNLSKGAYVVDGRLVIVR